MNNFFTKIALLGAFMFAQNSYAATPSWWDMTPQEVSEKINQRIMSVEAPTPQVYSVVDRTITPDGRNTPIRK